MKRKTIAILLSVMLASALALTGCDENGLPTEEEINELTTGLEEFGAVMEGVTSNVSEMTDGMDEYLDMAEDIEVGVTEAIDGKFAMSIDSVDDVAAAAGEIVSEAETVVDAIDASSPELEKLAEDLVNGYDDMSVIAEDIADIYTKEEVQALIDELEKALK